MSKVNDGIKFDTGKNRLDLIVPEFIEDLGRVLTFGAEKYGPNNWQQLVDSEGRYYAALQRHLLAYKRGEKYDNESGFPHLAHAACNLMFLHWESEVKDAPMRLGDI
jgi:hypothetical protein